MMRKLLSFFAFFICALASAQIVNIPDANFKAALLNHTSPVIDTNADGEIQESEAAVVFTLHLGFEQISDLTGIGSFTGATFINCGNNLLTTADFTGATALELLSIDGNQLTSLNLTQNPNLLLVDFGDNLLQTVDFTQNPLLDTVTAINNQLTELDFSQNPDLYSVTCYNNQIQSIDVSNSLGLVSLICYSNQITSLDLSNNSGLSELYADNNMLSSLDIKNGNNTGLFLMVATNNPNLMCINVDDEAYANAQLCGMPEDEWCKDATASYSESCNPEPIVNIPDIAFKTALLNHNPVINTNGDGEIQVSEAENFTDTMLIAEATIANLIGIEAFVNLENLQIGFNVVDSVDLSQNINLKRFVCSTNQFTSLDFSANVLLEQIEIRFNPQLVSVDVSQNLALTYLDIRDTALATLDVGANPNLTQLNVIRAELSEVDLSQNTALETLRLHYNMLTELDLSANQNLEIVVGSFQQIASIDVGNSPNLNTLLMGDNELTELDVTNNPLLENLTCHENDLTEIDLSNNPLLYRFLCYRNKLRNLDLSNQDLLETLYSYNNELERIDVKTGNNGILTDVLASGNHENLCIQVDDEAAANAGAGSYATWTKDATASYSENCAPLGVSEFFEEEIALYPNPTNDIVYIQASSIITEVEVFSVLGQLVLKTGSFNNHETQIGLSQLPSSTYFVKVTSEGASEVFQLIKE